MCASADDFGNCSFAHDFLALMEITNCILIYENIYFDSSIEKKLAASNSINRKIHLSFNNHMLQLGQS